MITYGGSAFVYVDGKGIKVEYGEGTRFTIEDIDCLFYFKLKLRAFSFSTYYEPHLEIGEFNIF
jgi:hypothetical protein